MTIHSDRIKTLSTFDIRFPTSELLVGSDAMNKEPDYSAAYLELTTESGQQGNALIFTIGRGNDICCQTLESMKHLVIGHDLATIKTDVGQFYDQLRADSQLRWLGPEKGVIHMANGAIMNAVWDLWARSEGKPVWRLLSEMSPEDFVDCLDLRYLEDALTRQEALAIVGRNEATKQGRIHDLERKGYPCYTTSAGWLGYDDDKLRKLCKEAVDKGFKHLKLKVGQNLEDDIRRCRILRETVGHEVELMIDSNQTWEVPQAVEWLKALAPFKPWFIEEPTSPDDILGHKAIKQAIKPMQVATGEHCHNRVMFKQFITSDAIDVVQIDACRLASLNEILAVYVLAAKYGKLVCPHAGGVGLCEYVQHLSMIDYTRISADLSGRVIEFVDHLHEHFEAPCVVENACYQTPNHPGFSIRMKESSISEYLYPNGPVWRTKLQNSKNGAD